MAIEKTINIDVQSKDALAGIKSIDNGLSGLDKSAEKGSKGVGGVSKAFKGLGTAIKAAGIGLVIAALAKLSEIFMQNQKVADLFNTAFEAVSLAFNDFVSFAVNSTSGIIKFFDAIFKNPLESLKSFADAFKKNIQERFDSYLDTLGFLASAVKKVFSGDFAGALDDVKNAGKESLDVLTGVNDSFDKGKEFIEKTTKAVKDYVTETVSAATANVQLQKQAELALVANQGLIEKYDRQAELLRQVRDDESKGIEERIQANKDLAKVLDDQEKAMKSNAAIQVAAAQTELNKNKQNIELQKAYQEALNEQAGIEAQITGFRSEQQTNTNSLLREQKELQNELALIGKSQRDIEREELAQELELKKELINREVTDAIERDALLLAAKTEFDTQLLNLNDAFNAEDLAAKTANTEAEIALGDAVLSAKVDQAKRGLQLVGEIAGEGSKIGKAVAIGQATISGVEGTINAFKTANSSPITAVFPAYPYIQAGLAAGFAATNIAKIKKTNPSGGGGGASAPSGGSAPSIPPAFNVVGSSDSNQLADAIGGQSQQPVQAFVVANDVTTAQSLQNNIVEGATIG
tara:strand:- start:1188 stop:2921 length:1734 start_codon:yes stop_codon:yes gene_type:complete